MGVHRASKEEIVARFWAITPARRIIYGSYSHIRAQQDLGASVFWADGYLKEIDRMQIEIREYLSCTQEQAEAA